jgi:hypothetical protein
MPLYDIDRHYCHDCGLRQIIMDENGRDYGAWCYECNESWSCSNCYGDEYTSSYECDSCQERDNDEYDDGCTCSACISDRENYGGDYNDGSYSRRDARVMSWNYKPEFLSKGNPDDLLTMGIELEYEGVPTKIVDAAEKVFKGLPPGDNSHLYFKEDGSIGSSQFSKYSTGVEMVSHPMTLGYARQFPFSDVLTELSTPAFIHEELGLHVHVARDAFTHKGETNTAHQMRWLMFMYRNVSGLEKIGRRDPERWAKFTPPQRGELRSKASAKKDGRRLMCNCTYEDGWNSFRGTHYVSDHSWDRYVAINVNNTATFELRFPMTTVTPAEFYATLELVHASVRYTGAMTARAAQQGALSWPAFTAYASKRNYKQLTSALTTI